ncbi:class I SAM-dependent methyltransferase [Pseudoalteromonas sp. S16_S37]|uniref:class I SAM-dependent methyltransferase n=1 Tax=Pseudoalteromonas sp. S16_S37 TaxID=2720228 RepID=UPI00167FEF50|nr:class I SAM-dependent methyltransferase [Pseudoalteromonas sp. S16_S37]MBD1583396.1 class I SAM-dependent methyltransferase [Pseudoalteromonas sp. S16_S37]
MPTHSFFWNCIANNYAKQPVADEMSYQKKLDHTEQYLSSDTRMLEFGCGTGSTATYHAPKVKHVHATDFSSKMLQIAKEKADRANVTNISFEQTQLLDLKSPDGSWDVVLGMSILHLLHDWQAHIAKVFELLKPGGVFVTSTACIGDMGTRFKLFAPLFKVLPFMPSVQVFSQKALKESLENAGFSIEYEWCPGPNKAVFMVARKPEEHDANVK